MSHVHIDVKDLSFSYENGEEIFQNLNLHIGENESVGLIGANGVGKSTLLKLLIGLDLNFTGNIRVMEIPVEKKTLSLVREKIGYVFQDSDSQLFMPTVEEDVAFAPRNYGLPIEEVEDRVKTALSMTGISHLAKRQTYQLSGGEKKLASIATILSMTPDIILMDEPSEALDPKNRRNLIRILNSFSHLKIIASHDLDFIYDTCKRTILLHHGEVVYDGPTEPLMKDRKLLEGNGLELPLSFSRMTESEA